MWTRLASDCSRLRATALRRASAQARHSSRSERGRVVGPACRRPMLRPNDAEMSRGAFLALVTSWCGGLAVLLLAALIVRVLG